MNITCEYSTPTTQRCGIQSQNVHAGKTLRFNEAGTMYTHNQSAA